MLLQITFMNLLSAFGPTLISMSFDIAILVFAIFIYKKNSYKYGLYLMISSIISIISNVIFIATNYPFLAYMLYGLPAYTVGLVLSILGLVFLALGISSTILFFLGIYKLYKTHKPNREN